MITVSASVFLIRKNNVTEARLYIVSAIAKIDEHGRNTVKQSFTIWPVALRPQKGMPVGRLMPEGGIKWLVAAES